MAVISWCQVPVSSHLNPDFRTISLTRCENLMIGAASTLINATEVMVRLHGASSASKFTGNPLSATCEVAACAGTPCGAEGFPAALFWMSSLMKVVLNHCGFSSWETRRLLIRPLSARATASMRVDFPDSFPPTIRLIFWFGSTVKSLWMRWL